MLVGLGIAGRSATGDLVYNPAANNTMIVILGDNGSYAPTVKVPFDPLSSKGTPYQTGVSVPFDRCRTAPEPARSRRDADGERGRPFRAVRRNRRRRCREGRSRIAHARRDADARVSRQPRGTRAARNELHAGRHQHYGEQRAAVPVRHPGRRLARLRATVSQRGRLPQPARRVVRAGAGQSEPARFVLRREELGSGARESQDAARLRRSGPSRRRTSTISLRSSRRSLRPRCRAPATATSTRASTARISSSGRTSRHWPEESRAGTTFRAMGCTTD